MQGGRPLCRAPLRSPPARPLRGALLTHHVSVGSYHVHSKLQAHKALCQAAHFPEPSCGQSARPSHAGLPRVPCNCKPTRTQGLGLQGPSPELRFTEPVLTLLTASRVCGHWSSEQPAQTAQPTGATRPPVGASPLEFSNCYPHLMLFIYFLKNLSFYIRTYAARNRDAKKSYSINTFILPSS